MAIRNDILALLKSGLEGITTDNGYSQDIKTVSRQPIAEFESLADGDCPAIYIDESGEEKIEAPLIGYQRRLMPLVLVCKVVDYNKQISDKFNLFIADLLKCLCSVDLGANCLFTELGTLTPFVGETEAFFRQQFMITYYFAEATP
jgi:hypothetical protein